ncbi:MAG: type II CRISPR-associated endonuclease Cas1 [Saprospiraceae bacterium]|nr:type II CRISPR-associated endonuclease Cas1 [Saprospiraceae bacterium]
MIKQTLYFGNPTYLKLKNRQLEIQVIDQEETREFVRPIEDIGVILLDNSQITITHNAIKALQNNKTAIISCDEHHMPNSLMLPLQGHTEQSERFRYQIDASIPLKKNLWQQTVIAKIQNQASVLECLGKSSKRLSILSQRVQSGDSENIEAQAAAYYWKHYLDDFIRDRYGEPPNNLLNYGYAIVRSMVARAIVASGLHPTLGIHHKNKYNAYCLADDIMEPFRPFVDLIAFDLYEHLGETSFLSKEAKNKLLAVATVDSFFGKKKRPLMVGLTLTTASLAQCYMGKKRRIIYPQIR